VVNGVLWSAGLGCPWSARGIQTPIFIERWCWYLHAILPPYNATLVISVLASHQHPALDDPTRPAMTRSGADAINFLGSNLKNICINVEKSLFAAVKVFFISDISWMSYNI
jgi:hypothetical protein